MTDKPIIIGNEPETVRVDLDRGRCYPNKIFERLMPEKGREMVLPTGALARVSHHNYGKRRFTLEIIGYLRKK